MHQEWAMQILADLNGDLFLLYIKIFQLESMINNDSLLEIAQKKLADKRYFDAGNLIATYGFGDKFDLKMILV